MKTVEITGENFRYEVNIDEGLRFKWPRLFSNEWQSEWTRIMVISDDAVAAHYLDDVIRAAPEETPVSSFIVPSGEQAKSFSWYEEGLTACLTHGLDRNSVILALGGGVVGDLAGFIAATYMRGISFIQMPSTFLAHDSSVGGKTGINHPLGKNMVGAFHQPAGVVYDTSMLQTLPEKEWRSGFSEAVKHGYIQRPAFLSWLKEHVQEMEDLKQADLSEILARSIHVKAGIVREDTFESGVRAFLNFGHTMGHALEKHLGYGKVTHGEAVASGMIYAMTVARHLGYQGLDPEVEADWLKNFGYEPWLFQQFDPQALLEAMKKDKKTEAAEVRMVLLEETGLPIKVPVRDEDLLKCMSEPKGKR
ncbi:3-dehydroquinate synthase [Salsuginibacillus halophilus]|uniref:3-dehydroquinate synthase n=1 Tax=Salsuginibacillus halophilus TaxID=517424 RepID=A0A2P8HWA0_9BACI|nr:3-dehydroquinate synthase [Salsuginibacillus halophilus]PSL50496.1 3-dehydroquinate synthase [Salsuginibacillus halophilus]